jgi:PadR family transcriptional regulator, regulatory protein AphA
MTLPYLLMGLLREKPLSGYDLCRQFTTTISHFWTTDQSQVYRAMYRMVEQGWVEAEVVAGHNAPNKKVYHLTEAGRTALHAWLQTPYEDDPPREGWLGQIFFADALSDEEVKHLLQLYADHLRIQLDELQALHQALLTALGGDTLPRPEFFRFATLEYGVARHRFELEWIESLLQRLPVIEVYDERKT